MKKTSIPGLIGAGLFVAAAFGIVTPVFYGRFFAIPVRVTATLWLMAFVCLVLAFKVKAAKKEDAHGIGLDNSQLNPMTVMNFMLVGRASAWTGAVIAGVYAGIGTYVLTHYSALAAAASDTPGVVSGIAGGVAMACAGVFLERQCEVPPPTDGAGAVS